MKGPFIKSSNTTSKMMKNLLISLIPIVLFCFFKNGIIPFINNKVGIIEMLYPLIFILIGTLSSLLTEEIYIYVFEGKRGDELISSVLNGYGLFPGLFLSLVLPINTPLAVLFIGAVVSIVIGKMLFGGFGNNIFNPALVGCIFVMASFSAMIGTNGGYLNKYEMDAVSSATPLTNVSLVEGIGTYDTLVKPYGNLLDFFIGTIPGAMGETSALLCLVAFIYLTLTKTIKWRIPVCYITTVFVMTLIIGLTNGLGIWYPLFEILSGGLFFGAIFMATDPVTSPVNKESQVIYGIALGLMTTLLRYLTPYPEGVMTSILLLNMFVFMIDKFTTQARFMKKNYCIMILIVLIITVVSLMYISNSFTVTTEDEHDSNYEIISKQIEENNTTYEVSQKGFGGKIKAKIVFEKDKIKSIEVLENSESSDRYKLVTDKKYLDTLIKSQDKIKDVDTVSSATITSTALKKMVINTLDDFSKNTGEVEAPPVEEKPKQLSITNVAEQDGITIYTASINSFNGPMTMRITMKGNVIKTLVPIDFIDTCITVSKRTNYYQCPEYMDEGYISRLIQNQDNVDSVDTVSGATISSSSLKETVKEIKEGN